MDDTLQNPEVTEETQDQAPMQSNDDQTSFRPAAPSVQGQNKVFVGNLPYTMDEEMLRQAFMQIGGYSESDITEVIVLKERSQDPTRPPRSRGIGFVGFATKELMESSLEKINGAEVEYEMRGEVMRRPIFVNVARPLAPREDRAPRY